MPSARGSGYEGLPYVSSRGAGTTAAATSQDKRVQIRRVSEQPRKEKGAGHHQVSLQLHQVEGLAPQSCILAKCVWCTLVIAFGQEPPN